MKRILTVCVALFLLFVFTSCAQERETSVCPFCNEQILTEAKYCLECGANISETEKDSVDYSVLDSGYCNQNVFWEIRSNGTLFIDGNGTIPNYSYREVDNNLAPWKQSAVFSEVKDIMIGDSISGIGDLGLHRVSINNLYIGHNVRACDQRSLYGIWPQNLYVSSQTNENTISSFLEDFTDTNCLITLYYDGSEEDFNEVANQACIKEIYYNYKYTVE